MGEPHVISALRAKRADIARRIHTVEDHLKRLRASLAHIDAILPQAEVTYAELAKRLKKHGLTSETEDSIKAKLKRGTFSATFLFACLAALELEGLRLEDL